MNLQVERAILHGMTWDDLKVFLEVARQRSHAGAARVLRVDASTVGRRVVALERNLSTQLFDRTPEGLAPTPAGEALLSRAERIESEVLALQRELAGTDARQSGSVQLTASDGVVDYVLVPRLIELQRAHPGLELSVRAEARVLDLSRREADVAVRLVRPTQSTLVGRRLGRMSFAFYAGQSYLARVSIPRNLAGLAGHAFIGFDRELEQVPTFVWLKKQVPELRLGLRANTTAAQVRACVAGVGIALLPRFIAPFEPGLVELFPRFETPTREVWAVSHRDLRRNPRVSLLIEWLTEIVASTPGFER
jgi:DNA-binding transcriptional LysR family regulator